MLTLSASLAVHRVHRVATCHAKGRGGSHAALDAVGRELFTLQARAARLPCECDGATLREPAEDDEQDHDEPANRDRDVHDHPHEGAGLFEALHEVQQVRVHERERE